MGDFFFGGGQGVWDVINQLYSKFHCVFSILSTGHSVSWVECEGILLLQDSVKRWLYYALKIILLFCSNVVQVLQLYSLKLRLGASAGRSRASQVLHKERIFFLAAELLHEMADRELTVWAEDFANENVSKWSGEKKDQVWEVNTLDILCKEIPTIGCNSSV